MKTQNLLFAAVGTIVVAGIAVYNVKSKQTADGSAGASAEQIDTKGRAEYEVFIDTTLSENGKAQPLFNIKGTLAQFEQAKGEFHSEWTAINEFKMNGTVLPSENVNVLIGKPILSQREGSVYTHFLAQDFPSDYSEFQNNIMRKFLIPIDLGATSPVLQMEADDFGNSNLRYDIVTAADGTGVDRFFLQSLGQDIRFDASKNKIHYSFAKDGRLTSINGEVLTYLNAEKSFLMRISVNLKASQAESKKTAKLNAKSMRNASMKSPVNRGANASPVEGILSADEVFAKLDTLNGTELRSEYNQMLTSLVHDMYYDPKELTKIAKKARSIKERDDDSKLKVTMLMASMAGTDTHEGAEALADLAKTSCEDSYCKEQATVAHAMHSNPSIESAKSILEVAQTSKEADLQSAAYLSAGAAGGHLGTQFAELPSALMSGLSQNPEGTVVHRSVLAAMGNHGDPSYFPVLKESLSAADSNDRSSAVFSLRNLPNPEASELIKTTFETDSDRTVVLDSVKAMHARSYDSKNYIEIADAGLKGNQEVQEATVQMLLDASIYNGGDSSDAIKVLREKSKYPSVKAIIDETLTRVEKQKALEESNEPAE